MERAFTVALVGFAQHESATFESFFRMAARRPPAYHVQDEVIDAQLLVVNADNAQAIELVRHAQLPGRVLLIGQHDAGTGWALARKPVKLVSVLAEMDRLAGVRSVPAAPPAGRAFMPTEPYQASQFKPLDESMRVQARSLKPRSRAASPETEFPPTRPMVRRMAAAPTLKTAVALAPEPSAMAMARRMARPGVVRLTDFGGLDELPSPAPMPAPRARASRAGAPTSQRARSRVGEMKRGDTLLVSDSLVEGRILHKRFARYGLKVDWSREGRQAEQMLRAHPYRLVVIDRVAGDPDAFQICRVARQQRLANGQPPAVLMFASNAGSMDRIKAGLAGSDAYLSRSVSEAELYRHLAQHRLVSQDAFAPTDIVFSPRVGDAPVRR